MVGKPGAAVPGPEMWHTIYLNRAASRGKEAKQPEKLPENRILFTVTSALKRSKEDHPERVYWVFIYFVVCVPCTKTHASHGGHVQVPSQVWELAPSLS